MAARTPECFIPIPTRAFAPPTPGRSLPRTDIAITPKRVSKEYAEIREFEDRLIQQDDALRQPPAIGRAPDEIVPSTREELEAIGVAVVSAAPGFTNIISSIANSFCDRTPVVYISTSAALADAETNNFMSGIDPVAMVKPVTKWAHCVTRTADIPRLLAPSESLPPRRPVPYCWISPGTSCSALRLLASAQRPVILAGEGAARTGVAEELRAFVNHCGVPVFAS
ncbi:MAG: thiamine pyrophosphate-binding protein [Steroidobacteraceae bacterium]